MSHQRCHRNQGWDLTNKTYEYKQQDLMVIWKSRHPRLGIDIGIQI